MIVLRTEVLFRKHSILRTKEQNQNNGRMRFNERELAKYAASDKGTDKEGYLLRGGEKEADGVLASP